MRRTLDSGDQNKSYEDLKAQLELFLRRQQCRARASVAERLATSETRMTRPPTEAASLASGDSLIAPTKTAQQILEFEQFPRWIRPRSLTI